MNISTRIINNILKNAVVIFVYHDVSNNPSPFSKKYNLNIPPDVFYSQVRAINNINPPTINEDLTPPII